MAQTIRAMASRCDARITERLTRDYSPGPPLNLPPFEPLDRGSEAQRAVSRKFEMLSLNGRRLHIPKREVIAPHRAEIEWHQAKVYRA